MKKVSLLLLVAGCVLAATPLHAQGGCVNSPENPTVVLGLVGTASVFCASLRARMRARRVGK